MMTTGLYSRKHHEKKGGRTFLPRFFRSCKTLRLEHIAILNECMRGCSVLRADRTCEHLCSQMEEQASDVYLNYCNLLEGADFLKFHHVLILRLFCKRSARQARERFRCVRCVTDTARSDLRVVRLQIALEDSNRQRLFELSQKDLLISIATSKR